MSINYSAIIIISKLIKHFKAINESEKLKCLFYILNQQKNAIVFYIDVYFVFC